MFSTNGNYKHISLDVNNGIVFRTIISHYKSHVNIATRTTGSRSKNGVDNTTNFIPFFSLSYSSRNSFTHLPGIYQSHGQHKKKMRQTISESVFK